MRNTVVITYTSIQMYLNPFCQLLDPDHVTIKDAAPELNTASKSRGKGKLEEALILSRWRDHTGGRGRGRYELGNRERERVFVLCVLALCVWWRDESLLFRDWFPATDCATTVWRTDCQDLPVLFRGLRKMSAAKSPLPLGPVRPRSAQPPLL